MTKSVEVMENVQNGYFFDKMAFFLRPSRADWLLIRRSLVRAQVEEPDSKKPDVFTTSGFFSFS